MEVVKHQFSNEIFYVPNWEVEHLLLGTFNPEGGEKVKYFYGRNKNRTWELLSEIFGENLNPKDDCFFDLIKQKGIACMDMIDSVEFNKNQRDYILGKGYSDNKIINNRVVRKYNTNSILSIIKNNPGIKVYSTWGNGSKLKSWNLEINKIDGLINLASPSMAARVEKGVDKYLFMLNDWMSKIKL